jgi:hypothetical protein
MSRIKRLPFYSGVTCFYTENYITPKSEVVNIPSIEKFKDSAVRRLINHNDRLGRLANKDINTSKSHQNYKLSPGNRIKATKSDGIFSLKSLTDYEYYKQRKKEVFALARRDVNTAIGVVISKPEIDMTDQDLKSFFKKTYDFLSQKFGGKNQNNILNSVVHMDETTPHLHFLFMPVVPNPNGRGGKMEKISAKEVIHKGTLFSFHRDFKKFLNDNNLGHVAKAMYTGKTKAQGGNRTVRDMKQEREAQKQREYIKQQQRGVYYSR